MRTYNTDALSAPGVIEPAFLTGSEIAHNDTDSQLPSTADPATSFLVDLGKIILKRERQEWMDVNEIAKMAKEHALRFQGHYAGPGELEAVLRKVFADKEEMYSDGVNVVFSQRRVKWDMLPMLRYYRHNPAWSAVNLNAAADETSGPSIAEN
jgi:hypothetical protein